MWRTFNCGIGMIAIVSAENVDKVLSLITDMKANVIGNVIHSKGNKGENLNLVYNIRGFLVFGPLSMQIKYNTY